MKEKYYKIYRYFILILMLLLSAINFNLLMKPINFVTGGTPGFAILVEHVFDVDSTFVIYLIYFIMFVISYMTLGKKSLLGIFIATIFYPIFVSLTSILPLYIIIEHNDILLIAIFSGIISGITNGVIYRHGFASSGLGILGPIFNKVFHLPIALTNFIVNAFIVLLGGYYFGVEMILYAIIFIALSSIISNRIIVGTSRNKAVFLSSKYLDEINHLLYDKYQIEPIMLDVNDNTKKSKNMIFILLSNTKYNLIMSEIKSIDKHVFYNVLDAYEVKR